MSSNGLTVSGERHSKDNWDLCLFSAFEAEWIREQDDINYSCRPPMDASKVRYHIKKQCTAFYHTLFTSEIHFKKS